MDELQASRVYTDFQGLATLRGKAREAAPEALTVAAKQFEAYLVQQLLRASREANPDGGLFGGTGNGLYEDMFDKQIALTVTAGRGLGVADLLVRQLAPAVQGTDSPTARPAASDSGPTAVGDEPQPATATPVAVRAEPRVATPAQPAAVRAPEPPVPAVPTVAPPPAAVSSTRPSWPLLGAGSPITQAAVAATRSADGPEGSATGPTRVRFTNAEAFVDAVMPHARQVGAELGVDPRLLVAQAALETGWGRSIIRNSDGSSSHNLFNIKAHRAWDGPVAAVRTKEYLGGAPTMVQAEFRSYESFGASFRDYVDFLKANPRYREALTKTHDPKAFAESLQAAGYATDPSYADKVMRIFASDRLAKAAAAPAGPGLV
ncbi:flagellar assembly peptidoglycan hydrolase FlgJ [Thioalkalicoccus limnaeus]|uniref:Peptidoglycan hydrolase FlgJ n=1 Tax=Thioalkalicoccus limnaeus TaxID=120681 RepID=A0ABV4BCK8_9GAMM